MPKFKSIDCLIVALVILGVAYSAGEILTTPKARPPRQVVAFSPAQAYADALNSYRQARGLPPCRLDKTLTKGAEHTARENAGANRLKHAPNCGAEVVAFNYEGFEEAVDQWDKSPGHCRIISDPKFKRIGCAEVRRGDRFYCCARFK